MGKPGTSNSPQALTINDQFTLYPPGGNFTNIVNMESIVILTGQVPFSPKIQKILRILFHDSAQKIYSALEETFPGPLTGAFPLDLTWNYSTI